MTAPMLPPPPDTEPSLPLVEFDDGSELWHCVPNEMADTWRPTGFESDSPEAL